MPKATKAAGAPSSSKLGAASVSKKRKSTGGSAPKLYSNFLPIALSTPTPIPIPSSSSKPLTSTTHHIYVRPDSSKASVDGGEPTRTVFVANLPVDITERDLREVFARWGVIESIDLTGGHEGDVLERAVMETLADEPESDESDNEAELEEEDGAINPNAELQFQGEKVRLPRRLRPKRRVLPASVPDLVPLPDLDPRSTAYGPSGARCAHITYLDPSSPARVMTHTGQIALPKYGAEPTGLEYYMSLHSILRPALGAVKEYADSGVARYDHLHSLLLSSRAKKQGAGALVDEDGFTVVVRGGRYGRTGGRGKGVASVGVAAKGFKAEEGKKARGAAELPDFYKFQKLDKKRKELADLRSKFEQDKVKVEEMKRTKRFKPY